MSLELHALHVSEPKLAAEISGLFRWPRAQGVLAFRMWARTG